MDKSLNSRVLGDNDSFSEVTEEIIGSETPVDKIISALGRRGCLELSSSIDLPACSSLPLAGGGFCDVFRGAMRDGTKIAIKSLRLYDSPGQDAAREKTRVLKRAARELYHWSKLKHINVLPLMGLTVFRGQMSMVSEWMENGNLMAFIERNPSADRIGLMFVGGYAISTQVKWQANVMISSGNRALIADFGSSQLRDITLKFSNTRSFALSTRWAAPELLDDEGVPSLSKPADVYAFGMTLLEALTGKVPHDELSDQRVVTFVFIKKKTPNRPIDITSDELWGILEDCWKWESSERPEVESVMKRLKHLNFRTSRPTITSTRGVETDQECEARPSEDHRSNEPHHMREGDDRGYGGQLNPVRRAPTPEGIVPPRKRMRQAHNPDVPTHYCETRTAEQAKQTDEPKSPQTNHVDIAPDAPSVITALPPTHDNQPEIPRTPSLADQPLCVFVGDITREANADNLQEFFNHNMTEIDASTRRDGNPVVRVQINYDKKYAFVIFRSAELAAEALVLDGTVFQSVPLTVRRYRPARRLNSGMGSWY